MTEASAAQIQPTRPSDQKQREGLNAGPAPAPQPLYALHMKVRDYECDLQGIVNNANYLHYTEHTRHEFLLAHGISFADLHERGIDAVVARINMQFKTPLHSGDEFLSCLDVRKEGVKYIFDQKIYRMPDHTLANRSEITTVCLINGRLGTTPELDALAALSATKA